jgi:hypothetical protein
MQYLTIDIKLFCSGQGYDIRLGALPLCGLEE